MYFPYLLSPFGSCILIMPQCHLFFPLGIVISCPSVSPDRKQPDPLYVLPSIGKHITLAPLLSRHRTYILATIIQEIIASLQLGGKTAQRYVFS